MSPAVSSADVKAWIVFRGPPTDRVECNGTYWRIEMPADEDRVTIPELPEGIDANELLGPGVKGEIHIGWDEGSGHLDWYFMDVLAGSRTFDAEP